MYWEDVELKEDSNGLQFLEFTERLTKTRRGANAGRAVSPKMFPAEDKTRCPIEAYKLYQSLRPKIQDGVACKKFYLAINHQYEKKNRKLVQKLTSWLTLTAKLHEEGC